MDLAPFYQPRHEDARKGDFGRVLVVGGSGRYAGAPTFNALAAMRAGADLAFVVAPRRAADLIASYSPDLITIPCASSYPDPNVTKEFKDSVDAVVIGGGIERTGDAHEAILKILRLFRGKPVVADAEALHAIASEPRVLDGSSTLLTPHGGEFQVLTGKEWPTDMDARKAAAKEAAKRFDATIIVKGRWDVVSDGERVHVDDAGSPFLTKGGYGDLLAGVAGALLARGQSAFDAARAAAFIVGRAGEIASADLGESTFATDTLARFPQVVPRGGTPAAE